MRMINATFHFMKFVMAFLHNRFQAVQLNGVCSKQMAVTSGIIRGSVLGPTLFTLYMNDLPAPMHAPIVL